MPMIVFLSAVSEEFHKPGPTRGPRFLSYRDVLANALRRLGPDYSVIVQEDLAQGFGDLLNTLDDEVRRSEVVVHLVGDLAGSCPEPVPVRRLRERHPKFLAREPELARELADAPEISYTQWEVYLAFEHGRKRLVFLADPEAPRSHGRPAGPMDPSQAAHLARLKRTGEHRERFEDQRDLALKVVTSLVRSGPGPALSALLASVLATARQEVAALIHQIADALRKPAKTTPSTLDPAGVDAYLAAVDTVAIQRELSRRQALELVAEHRDELREAVAADPTEADLRELALAELALGHYPEAIEAARRCAEIAEAEMASDPDRADDHRQMALNAYLLLREAAEAARRRDEALAALERGCALIDRGRDPILWADYHEELAEVLLDQGQIRRAEELVDEIVDIREGLESNSAKLAISLLLWCRLLDAKADFEGVVGVARRAEQILAGQSPPKWSGMTAAMTFQANALGRLGRLEEAEPLYRRALAIDEAAHGPDHPKVASNLGNLAGLLRETGRPEEDEPLARRALVIAEAAHGPDHPAIGAFLNVLAGSLRATGRLDEAEPLFRRALAIDEAAHGPDHPMVATCLNNLAVVLRETGRQSEAEPLFRRALSVEESSYGPDHPEVAVCLNNLALVLRELGRLDEAEPLFRRALAIDEAARGPDHPAIANDLTNLAGLLRATNRRGEVEPLYRRAIGMLARFGRSTGYQHPNWSAAVANYSSLLTEMNLPEPETRRRLEDACDEVAPPVD